MFELRNKSFYKKTLRLMAPIILQQLISVGVNFMDNLMIGGFGEASIAAAAFSNQVYTLFNFIVMGLGSGAVVLSSQFWGRKEIEPMRKVTAIAMRLALALCVLFTAAAVGAPGAILRIFTNESDVIAAGIPYLRLIGITFILSGLSSTATYLLRSVGMVRIPLIGSAGAFFLNIFFNWVFIFGTLGAPALGLVGAAVGTVIARVFEFAFVFGYFVLKDDRVGFRIRHLIMPAGDLLRSYFKFGLPVLVSDTLLGVSLSITGVILGRMGAEASAAASIVMSLVNLIDIACSAMAFASAIVVGNTIGEGDIPRARREGNTYMVLSVVMGAILVLPMWLVSGPYLSAYNIGEETVHMAKWMLVYNYITLPIQANAYATSKGVLRGGGDTRFLLVADSILVWLFSIPVGAVAGLIFHISPIWVYIIVRVQFPLKGIVCFVRYCTGKWIREIKVKKDPVKKENPA